MAETDAIIGGESSGGMAVKGHIYGKDGIYAAALLVEMLAVTGKSIGQLYEEIIGKYGNLCYEEWDCRILPEKKQLLQDLVFTQRQIPDFRQKIAGIRWNDGCKVCFTDGSWIICRLSGTEPLLRFAAEGTTPQQTASLMQEWKNFLDI